MREAVSLALNSGRIRSRATMRLARLLATQDHRDEARTMLAQIYNRFTEGFDTADLIDAKRYLNELGGTGE